MKRLCKSDLCRVFGSWFEKRHVYPVVFSLGEVVHRYSYRRASFEASLVPSTLGHEDMVCFGMLRTTSK